MVVGYPRCWCWASPDRHKPETAYCKAWTKFQEECDMGSYVEIKGALRSSFRRMFLCGMACGILIGAVITIAVLKG